MGDLLQNFNHVYAKWERKADPYRSRKTEQREAGWRPHYRQPRYRNARENGFSIAQLVCHLIFKLS